MKPLLLQALEGSQALERPPVWIMRQAGRYMEEYRALRRRHDFLTVCRTPELAVEVTMQPINFLNPDAAIIFSDILIPASAMGIDVDFAPGPVIANPIKSAEDVSKLKAPNIEKDLAFTTQAIAMLRRELENRGDNKAVLGFAGAPWTLACYAIDRGPFKHFENGLVFANQARGAMHSLLEKLTAVVSDYLIAQCEAGAGAVQLFDSWGGVLSGEDYAQYSLPYIQKVCEKVRRAGYPLILYVGGGSHLLKLLTQSGADCLSVDWRLSLGEVEEIIGSDIAIQGNLNPAHLYGSTDSVYELSREMIGSLNRRSRYIANLGHGILPTTPPENALQFIQAVQEGWAPAVSMQS
ncbi:MAG: uroporphyrinogen decarboxylase [Bdellovibrionales bacterium]|nr:uroporphyrinogen decarboxylase [Bdellovibrionales bacterium]